MRIKIPKSTILISLMLALGGVVGIIISQRILSRRNDNHMIDSVKVLINHDGIYKLAAETLEDIGMPIDGIDLSQLRLSLRGVEQSLFVFHEGTTTWLEFYGNESESLYSSSNIYILELVDSPVKSTILADSVNTQLPEIANGGGRVYQEEVHIEQNLFYFPQILGYDHWYWLATYGGQSYSIPILLEDVAPGDGWLRIALWGNTESPANPDHHIIARLNGHLVLDKSWDGMGEYLLEAMIQSEILLPGENSISIEVVGDTSAAAEVNWLNWVEVRFPRYTVAQSGSLGFIAEERPLLLRGFTGPTHIYDISTQENVAIASIAESTVDGFEFKGIEDHTYIAVDSSGYLYPNSLVPLMQLPDLRENQIGTDYIVIGPSDLLSAVDDLLTHRKAQGLRVMTVPLQAIYDQYHHGFPEPEAIREFLISAISSWEIHPQYVLLLGDASYDPRNYLEISETNILPAFFVQTIYGGQTASDYPFSDVNGDGLPDLSIGRVPATSVADVLTFVRKTISYETASWDDDHQKRVAAIADGQEDIFQTEAKLFIAEIGDGNSAMLFTPEPGTLGNNETIRELFDDGYLVVAYYGHGSIFMWGKDRLFTSEDADALTNTTYPLVINMTCLTGLFTYPQSDSLTEVLLLNPDGGAVAVLAPTSLTLSVDQQFLGEPLARELRDRNYERLGDIYRAAQLQVSSNSVGVQDVLDTFLLFGDPALIIK